MPVITVDHLTQDYGHGRGVFDVSLQIEQGECYGFLGPNGAGKTTTIRHLMGFSKPQQGTAVISGLDTWKNSAVLQNTVGYLPGEVTLPTSLSGTGFLRMMEKMRKTKNDAYLQQLLERFELDPDISIKRMSLGVKRKLAVVTAFMHDPDILILDEPTSGLDPVMQQTFIEFVQAEKARGKTIFLSSHIFREVDATCDRIAIIRDGKIISEFHADELKQRRDKIYSIVLQDTESYQKLIGLPWNFTLKNPDRLTVRVQLQADQAADMTEVLSGLRVADFTEIAFTLEDYFMGFYETEHHFMGVEA